jgi:carbamoyltransferase
MNILGISAGFHDAAASLVNTQGDILFAGHSERYSKNKHDKHLCDALLADALWHGSVSEVAYYEKPLLKKAQQAFSGQWDSAITEPWSVSSYLAEHTPNFSRYVNEYDVSISTHSHHLSHAAASFQTSPFDRATVVVIDAIGELDTISIYGAEYDGAGVARYKKLWSQRYPHSIGLFYTAMTKRVGLRPLDEEYILMGMAGYGKPHHFAEMWSTLIADHKALTFKQNLHAGVDEDFLWGAAEYDIAASAQKLVEVLIDSVIAKAAAFKWSPNLVYTGGVALNCHANRNLGNRFDNLWTMPNPGDAGSSLGAAALAYGRQLNWEGPYLGTDIKGQYPVRGLIRELKERKIVGVASGRAEFGPRALGNRSLLADPRGTEIKDQVNQIKRRQAFRPFAPVILEEYANLYFSMPHGWRQSQYMQVTAPCQFPELYPAIIHVDGTSRVQTVPYNSKSGIRQLLEKWYEETGCPMLLNTSLNIRGEPMVNDRADADRFEQQYGITVLS